MLLERVKARRSEQTLFLETRMRLWLDCASAFSAYLLSWSRLIAIAKYEQDLGTLSDLEAARKNKYVDSRNDARQQLHCCLDQAFLFFSKDVIARIDAFRDFDQRYRIAKVEEMPTHNEWQKHQANILTAMKYEVGVK